MDLGCHNIFVTHAFLNLTRHRPETIQFLLGPQIGAACPLGSMELRQTTATDTDGTVLIQ